MMSELKHEGVKERSGRYPWGSGENPYQRGLTFQGYVRELEQKGYSESEIAKELDIEVIQLRARKTIAREDIRAADASRALRLLDKGYSKSEIGRLMGRNESSIRQLLNPVIQERANITRVTAEMLRDAVEKNSYVDVGAGVERYLGISNGKLKAAVELLVAEGYTKHHLQVQQAGTGKQTSLMVLAPPDTDWKTVNQNKADIVMPTDRHTIDGGRTWLGLNPIQSVPTDRIDIRYSEDGGSDKDGIIELRRGVADLDLGDNAYAQVRIGVNDTHFIKGMAVYSDDIPPGKDIVFNTNKSKSVPMISFVEGGKEVLKPMKDDPANPFGAVIKGNSLGQRGALNILKEEGDWGDWSRSISSQILSKQHKGLIKKQLGIVLDQTEKEFEEVMSLTNPTVKKKLLQSFADSADASAVHLKAAALPRQQSQVLIPYPDIKPTEVYAPQFRDGETVALFRHPHGGVFEIPELTVNNKYGPANKQIGRARDAIGIHPSVAEQLSGADFDGDAVVVMPTKGVKVKTSAPLQGLKNFDPKEMYPNPEGGTRMTSAGTQKHMGKISNLITDMTIKGAPPNEIARAVRHSMVVIDAEKHNLNYKLSEKDNKIGDLKAKYQGGRNRGASTLISRSSSELRVDHRKPIADDPDTGEKRYRYTEESYTNKAGKVVKRTTQTTKMAEAKDAFELSSGTDVEAIYAEHANNLKSIANKARLERSKIEPIAYSPTAKVAYKKEVDSLNAKLNIALMNAPLERQAQLIVDDNIKKAKLIDPDLSSKDLKKMRGQGIVEARIRVGAGKEHIEIEQKEWEAIQAGAITPSKLNSILDNTKNEDIKKLATPRQAVAVTPSKKARIKALANKGYTQAEIASAVGLSTSTINKVLE